MCHSVKRVTRFRLPTILATLFVAIHRMDPVPEATLDAVRDAAQRRSGRQLPDLNLYYIIDLPAGVSAAEVASRLNALAIVEFAEPARRPAPPPTDIPPTTPDFT